MRCFFGLHRWSEWVPSTTCDTGEPYLARRCSRCRMIRVIRMEKQA